MSTIFPWTLSQRKVKMRTSGFRTPTNQKKHHKGCLSWNVLYKASLYGLLAWTYFYNAKAKFWLQKLALGTELDIEHIDWSLLTFFLFRLASKCLLINIQICHLKKQTKISEKKKKSHCPGALYQCKSKQTQALLLPHSLTNQSFLFKQQNAISFLRTLMHPFDLSFSNSV